LKRNSSVLKFNLDLEIIKQTTLYEISHQNSKNILMSLIKIILDDVEEICPAASKFEEFPCVISSTMQFFFITVHTCASPPVLRH
jgi:hypothetical protein